MSNAIIDQRMRLCDAFNREIGKLIKLCLAKFPQNGDLERLRNLISLAKAADSAALLDGCKDYLWTYNDQIVREDEQFFLSAELPTSVTQANTTADPTKDHATTAKSLISMFRLHFPHFLAAEKAIIWKSIKEMLRLSIEYRLSF